jgi:kynurenine/2-aminoadipate aminotransferase
MRHGLQYSESVVWRRPNLLKQEGIGAMHSWVRHRVTKDHSPKFETASFVTSGSQQGLAFALDLLLDEGDSVVVENPAYPGALALLRWIGADIHSAPFVSTFDYFRRRR